MAFVQLIIAKPERCFVLVFDKNALGFRPRIVTNVGFAIKEHRFNRHVIRCLATTGNPFINTSLIVDKQGVQVVLPHFGCRVVLVALGDRALLGENTKMNMNDLLAFDNLLVQTLAIQRLSTTSIRIVREKCINH